MSSYSTIKRRASALKKALLMHGGRLDTAELAATHDALVDLVEFTDKVRDLHAAPEWEEAPRRTARDDGPGLYDEDEDPFAAADRGKSDDDAGDALLDELADQSA